MRHKNSTLSIFFAVIAALLVTTCTGPTEPDHTGTATETENVAGMIVDENGSPVKGATVRLVPVAFNPHQLAKSLAKSRSLTAEQMRAALLAAVDSAVTDSNGQFAFDSVDTGTYNVLADSGTSMAFQDSIAVEPDTQTAVPTDTLKAPGSVRGVVRLQPGHDSRTVFLIALGTFAVTAPSDTIGNFALSNMAEGTYSTRILSTRDDYAVLDTAFSVIAGIENVLADTIALPFIGIPIPQGLAIDYDTLTQIVTLTWNKPTVGRPIKGYNVYRKHQDSTSFVKIAGVIADTVFVDSTAVQDYTYEYKLAAVDNEDVEGVKSIGDSVNISSAFEFVKTIGLYGVGVGQYENPMAVAVNNRDEVFVADYSSGKILFFDSAGVFIREVGGFDRPNGLEIAFNGTLFVLEYETKLIKHIDSSGNILSQTGGNGTIPGKFGTVTSNWGAAISQRGELFIPDFGNNRIQIFDSSLNVIKAISVIGPNSITFIDSMRLAVGSGVDINQSKILVLDTSGTILNEWNSSAIISLHITPKGSLIGVGRENKIYAFSSNGELLARTGGTGVESGKFQVLRGLRVANFSQFLYAFDDYDGKVKKFIYPEKL